MILGGGTKTAQFAHLAPYLGVPYLPVPRFGGEAAKLWPALKIHYTHAGIQLSPDVEDIETWTPDRSVDASLRLAQRIAQSRVFSGRNVIAQYTFLAALLLGLTVWVVVFSNQSLTSLVTLFAMMALASFLGSGLRILVEHAKGLRAEYQWEDLLTTTTISSLIAFFLFMLYLAGGLSIQGNLDFLDMANEPRTFQRLAITTSLIGGVSGFLTEHMAKVLAARLGDIFTRKQ